MTDDEIAAYVDAAAAALGLPLSPRHRSGTLGYFALAAGMAALVEAHPLTLQDEPADVFVPISRGGAS